MQIGGFSSAGAIWLGSLGKTGGSPVADLFATDGGGQKEPAKAAGANTHFPTAPPVNLGADALLALQQVDAQADKPSRAAADEAQAETLDASAADEFLDYMKKTPEERLREKILKALGVTEDELAAMPAEERLAIEKKIADIVKETIVPKEVTRGAEAAGRSPFAALLDGLVA